MEDSAASRAAEWLVAEHQAGRRFKTLGFKTLGFKTLGKTLGLETPGLETPGAPAAPATISDAYDIQDRYVALLRRGNGEPTGYKVGLTSAPMQAFCRIDHPIGGVVLARRVHRTGAGVRRSDFGRLGLEFEIAVRIKSDIAATETPHTPTTIEPHIEAVCAALELVDDRAADYTSLDVLSLVADNSWNGGIVLSEFKSTWPDLTRVLGRATRNGEAIGEGRGSDILGHPFNSVAWLASHLASRGAELKAGEIVMTGSVMKTVFPEQDAHYRFDLEGIGSVELQVS